MSQTRELSLATIAYAVLTLLMTLPFSLAPATHVTADVPDTHLYIWTLAWNAYAFTHQPLQIFDANIYHPFANTLAYSENLIGSAFFAAPIIWLTGNMVLATNLTALLTCVLCGTGAFLLGRRLHLSVAAAFVCGLVFAFAPPRFFRLGQLHLTAVQWIPFCLAFLHSYLEAGRRRDLLLAIGCFSLQALSSGHGAVYLAIATALLLLWHVALGTPIDLMRRLRDVGAAGAYLLAPSVWVIVPYRLAQDEAGLRREWVPGMQPGIESLLASPSLVHQFLIAHVWGPFEKEPAAYLFPGVLVLVLAAIGVSGGSRRSSLRDNSAAFHLLLGVLCSIMFIDWPFEPWKFVYWLPGFNFIRVPSRFIIMSVLALAVLAGFGVDRLIGWVPRARVATATVVCLLLVGEYATYPFPSVPFAAAIPAVDQWLNSRPKPFVVAELPVPSAGDSGALERQQTQAMLHATAHWQKTIHGYSGIRRPYHDQLYADLNRFPDPTSLNSLREVGVTYIVVHTEAYGITWRTVEEQIARSGQLKLEHSDGDGRVYSLLPR
ncbi:MAG: hypothetical protein ACKOEC_16155 [Acidimicrobiia bacterium]